MRFGNFSRAVAFVLCVTYPAGASAQEADACAALRDPAARGEPTLLTHNGTPGMWFSMPQSRLMLCELRELRIRNREISLTNDELELWSQRVDLQSERARLAIEARNELESVVEASERRARQAQERLDAWDRAPALWFVLGAVLGLVLAFGAGAIWGELSSD